MTEGVTFRQVADPHELAAVARFWNDQFLKTAPYLSERPSEPLWLGHSLTFAGFHGQEVVAACRVSPHHSVLGWEASADVPEFLLERFDTTRFTQLNRVAVKKEFRNGRLHERLFLALAKVLLRDTGFDGFFSIIREPVVRLYKTFGINPITEAPLVLPARSTQRYALVEGHVAYTYRLLSEVIASEQDELLLT